MNYDYNFKIFIIILLRNKLFCIDTVNSYILYIYIYNCIFNSVFFFESEKYLQKLFCKIFKCHMINDIFFSD